MKKLLLIGLPLLLIVGCSNNSKLSSFTENIIKSLDDPLTIKVYFSDNLPAELGNTRRYLVNLLKEYEAVSRKINFSIFDPSSDSELEEKARKDGIQPVQMQALENDQMVVKKVYLGMVLLYEDKKEILPVIQTTTGLEYMVSTKIKSLINLDKKTVGLMHLDPNNTYKNENIKRQLDQHYTFRSISSENEIPDNIDLLLLTGAVDTLAETTINSISSFLEAGKKILLTQSGVNADIQTQQASPIQSNIFDFLKSYRLDLKRNLVLDGKCGKVNVQVKQGVFLIPDQMDYPFFPIIDKFNKNQIVVADLEQVHPLLPSEIQIDSVLNNNVETVTTLFKSSDSSGLMSSNFLLSPDPKQNPFLSMLGQKGKILAATSKLKNGGELMLISDSGFLNDEGSMGFEENIVFIMNAVDYLVGDQELILLRNEEFNKNISFDESLIQKISDKTQKISNTTSSILDQSDSTPDDSYKKLKKYKQMLDEGLIEQEDYDAKKKELLGL